MPILYGCASAHAPSLTQRTYEGWQRYHQFLNASVPQPAETELETPEVIADFVRRGEAAIGVLASQLRAMRPDVLIVVGGDQNEWFHSTNLPNLLVYKGERVTGYHNIGCNDGEVAKVPWEHPDEFAVSFPVDQVLAHMVLEGLVERGFDACISSEERPRGVPPRGGPHSLTRQMPLLWPENDLPIVPVMIRTVERSSFAVMTGERSLALGRALADICRKIPKRIAIYGSGGMSHDPRGPRSGWVDEPLDRWFLNHIQAGEPDKLSPLFSFQSEATWGGTGELRTWMAVAAAMDEMRPRHKAIAVDYFAARKVATGCGWAYWPALDSNCRDPDSFS